MVRWGKDHFFFIGKDYRLQNIDCLSQICHPNSVGMVVENV
jgi:hypothetical protein